MIKKFFDPKFLKSSKINKIFLAIILTLSIILLLEYLSFSQYKTSPIKQQTSKDQNLERLNGRFIPNNPALNPKFIDAISIWPYYENQKTTLINTISGVFLGIEQPNEQNLNSHYIKIKGTPGKDIRGIGLVKEEWDTIKVYDATGNGSQTPIKITDLTPGDFISLNEIFENTYNLTVDSPTSLTIIRTKKAQ